MPIDGIPLIDVHVHAARTAGLKLNWDRWIAARRTDGSPRELYDGEGTIVPERFHAMLEREGVDLALLMAEYSPRVTGIQPAEDMVPLSNHDPARVRFIANVNPLYHFPVVEELERQLGMGAVALKIHPVHGAFPPNTAELYPAYGVCQERGIPVVFHCGTSNFPGAVNRFGDPVLVEDVAKDFPRLRIVLAHGGRGWWYDAAAFMALMREFVYVDIAGLPPQKLPEYYRSFDFERLAARFVFGSDWPGAPGIRSNAEAVRGLGLSRGTLERVFHRNAEEVYGLRA